MDIAAIGRREAGSDCRPAARLAFPVGYHALHPDASLNFQANRWYGWVGDPEMLQRMRAACGRIADYADWKREFLALASQAERSGQLLRAGYCWRAAEFFMDAKDADRPAARRAFLAALRTVHAEALAERHDVPYADSTLPAYRLRTPGAKATVVFFGGFDSYIEELTPAFLAFNDAGYEVVAFEGPGQGGALEDSGLPMTRDWHKPVAAVLDHFGLQEVALVGLSLGGGLAIRAAAFEPRVRFVVAYDILQDFFEVTLRQTKPVLRGLIRLLVRMGARATLNTLAEQVARRSPVARWGMGQGCRVTGSASAFEFFLAIAGYRTDDVSPRVRQDVLLLAGQDDHYVPLQQLHRQLATLTAARSVTARVFTAEESAQNHCQVGNYGLAIATITGWLDERLRSWEAST
jgi:pimeloyl-ACP methyl ester carboxylesterase